MSQSVTWDRVDFSAGQFFFAVQADNTFSIQVTAHKKDANGENGYGVMATAYPPGFTATDQQNLLVLLNKLAREMSKVAINATNVTRQGQVYVEAP